MVLRRPLGEQLNLVVRGGVRRMIVAPAPFVIVIVVVIMIPRIVVVRVRVPRGDRWGRAVGHRSGEVVLGVRQVKRGVDRMQQHREQRHHQD